MPIARLDTCENHHDGSRQYTEADCDVIFFFSSRRRHTRSLCDWSSAVCSSDLHGEPLTPLLVEALERVLGGVGVDGCVDRLQVAGDLLAFPPRDVVQAEANEVNDACLDGGLREDRLDRLGEPLEPVDAADQDVADAALLEV